MALKKLEPLQRWYLDPPGEIDVPSMAKPAGFAVNTWPPTVKTSSSWYVFVLMARPEGLSDTGVPDIVTPGPPVEMLVPADRGKCWVGGKRLASNDKHERRRCQRYRA